MTNTEIDRAAEANQYEANGRECDRISRETVPSVRIYKGRYAHEWFSLAGCTRRHFGIEMAA